MAHNSWRTDFRGYPSCWHGENTTKTPPSWLTAEIECDGYRVADSGDLPVTPGRPLGVGLTCRDLDRVALLDHEVSARVAEIAPTNDTPLVLGGDCTITLGVAFELLTRFPNLGVMYFDGDVDLTTPDDSSSGILDAMVSAHLLGHVDNILSRIGPRFPLLATHDIVYFGYHPMEFPPHLGRVVRGQDTVEACPQRESTATRGICWNKKGILRYCPNGFQCNQPNYLLASLGLSV